MDERHLWFAGKLQETFRFGGYDSPSVLEDFLADFEVAELITKFLSPGEPRRLFFYCEEGPLSDQENGGVRTPSAPSRQLRVTSKISRSFLPSLSNDHVCLYVLRRGDPAREVDQASMDSELYCGEIRHSVLDSLATLLSNAYSPLLHQQSHWGQCTKEGVATFLQTFDKLTGVVQEMAVQSLSHEALLQTPSAGLKGSLLHFQPQPGAARINLSERVVLECETLMNDWIAVIEGLLISTTDERLEDPLGLPLAERQKWERRQIHLFSVIEQLKWRESTTVIATLAAAKSKLLKKWRVIDIQLTEAFNGCKDKVWFLSTLQPHLDGAQSVNHPSALTTDILPAIVTSIKQMEGLSRLFARTGYIAVVLKKIANLFATKCQQLLNTRKTANNTTTIWTIIFDGSASHLKELDNFVSHLQQIVELSKTYKEAVHHLKDTLLIQQNFAGAVKRSIQRQSMINAVGAGIKRNTMSEQNTVSHSSTEIGSIPQIQSGLSMNNISDIVAILDELSTRADGLLEIIETVRKLMTLWPCLTGLPRLVGVWESPTERLIKEQKSFNDEDSDCEREEVVPVYSDESEDSVASLVKSVLFAMKSSCEAGCPEGVVQLFALSGKDSGLFEPVLVKFNQLLQIMLEHLSNYLQSLIPQVNETSRALDILGRFDLLSSWQSLKDTLHHCLMIVFKKYSQELTRIQKCYEDQKECPPLPHGRPPLVGGIEWSRGLLRRVEGPMQVFREDEMLMKTPESHYVCTLHNRLATTLIQYEAILMKQLRERMDKTMAAVMAAPLLRLQDDDEKDGKTVILVNSDTGLLQLLEETKALKQLYSTIPSPAQALLSQEARIKSFNQHLQYAVDQLTAAISSIDKRLSPLYNDLIDTVLRFFLPGWTTLTWSTLNIDPYLHQLGLATSLLQSTITSCNNILQERVYPVVESIAQLVLVDKELATSKVWALNDFSDAMFSYISEQNHSVVCKTAQIRTALFEALTHIKQSHDRLRLMLSEHSNTISKSKDYVKIPAITKPRTSRTSGPTKPDKPVSRDTKKSLDSLPANTIERVLRRFSNLIQRAVGRLVQKSLCLLHQCICQSPVVLGASESEEEKSPSGVRVQVHVLLTVPRVILTPSVLDVYESIGQVLVSVASLLHEVQPWGVGTGDEEERVVEMEGEQVVDTVHEIQVNLKTYFEGLNPHVISYIESLKRFDHLWQKDLYKTHSYFQKTNPSPQDWKQQVLQLVKLEKEIASLPSSLNLGPIQLIITPLRSTLQALASNWKSQFASHLHILAKTALNTLVDQQKTMMQVLTTETVVGDLFFLREVLELLEHIDELHHSIDDQYLPVEEMYSQLKEFGLTLQREESEQVNGLREQWNELSEMANKVYDELLVNQRLIHIQETVKQVKDFVVQTIQFRNAFDAEGPLAPGLTPSEAVSRVGYFIENCGELQKKRDLLDAVQKLLNIPLTPYVELEQTQEELSYLKALYSNYQDFINFDEEFRNVLWCEVDLNSATEKIEKFWQAFLSLPKEQQEWEASHKLNQGITNYRQILPLLNKLHNKEIKSRHWLQIMAVTNYNFPLEARLFKLDHLLEAELLRFTIDINGIIENAQKEQELELEFLAIEEEWSEKCFQFEEHSSSSLPLLSPSQSLSLLEHLDSTQTQLTVMLMSGHIQPLRNETAQWAGKLATIAEVLQLWLSVQELWLSLQPVFNSTLASKNFPNESVAFCDITEVWTGVMKQAASIRNCIQCCITGDEPIQPILHRLKADLEKCKMSLSSYLTTKRQIFTRLYFIPDDALLTLLSNSLSTTLIKPYLGSLFGGVAMLLTDPGDPSIITSVASVEGEELQLAQTVCMSGNDVEVWLISLLASTQVSIQQLLLQSMDSDLPSLEELVLYQLTQVACVSLHHQWTKDCEQALASCRYDRRAIPGLRSKFNNLVVMKLNTLLMRQSWRHSDEAITQLHHSRLESLITLSLWLRDLTDDLCQRKIRDALDFEWIRFPRLLLHISGKGEQDIRLHCLDVELPYNNEFLGCKRVPVFTPRTNNYIISLSQSLKNSFGSCIVLPPGSKNSEITKGLGYLVGQFTPTLHCTSLTDVSAIAQFLTGLAQAGSWACICNIHLLPKESLSLLAAMLNTLFNALKAKQSTVNLSNGLQVNIHSSMAVFLTHIPNWSLPTNFVSVFRSFSFPFPDSHVLLRTYCLALGLKGSKVLIYRLQTLLTLIANQISNPSHQPHVTIPILCRALEIASKRAHSSSGAAQSVIGSTYTLAPRPEPAHKLLSSPGRAHQGHKTSPTSISHQMSQPLNAAVLREHILVAETLAIVLGARFTSEELPIFHSILEDVFGDCPDIGIRISAPDTNEQLSTFLQSTSCFRSQLSLLEEQARHNGYTPTRNWLLKTEQLYLLSRTNHALVLAGREASGKTSALKTVVSALGSKEGDTEMKTVRLQKIYPGVFTDDLSDVYGCVDKETGLWRDGIFTALIRKSNKATQTTVWVCFDGPLILDWFDHLGELTSTKCMSLANGELVQINTDTIKLVFETGQLANASPAALTHCGVVSFDSQTLGWRALASSWLKTRRSNESMCLQRLFESAVDTISQFILYKLDYHETETEVALFQSCLNYLSSLLNAYTESAEVFSELHVERIFLFSMIWSFGGVILKEKEREKFSELLRQLTTSLPDDDTDYSVFDYYVDESGEWDVWQSKVPEQRCQGVDLMSKVFIETITTIRVEMLLELALASKRHVLLVGPHASGKTAILNRFLAARALHFFKTESVKRLVANGHTVATDIHQFMKINLHHRQGYTYGPNEGRCLHLMLDDLHLPQRELSSVAAPVSAYEYLRQIADDQGIYNLIKTNQGVRVEDVLFFASVSSNQGAAILDQRLKRHFIVIPIESLSEEDLTAIVPIALTNFTALDKSISSQLFQSLSEASRLLYQSVSSVLRKSDTIGRQHYFFSLNCLESALPGLGFCHESSDSQHFVSLWISEMKRAFGSSLCREEDKKWLNKTVLSIAEKCFEQVPDTEDATIFCSISPHIKKDSSRLSSSLNTMPAVTLHQIDKWLTMEESIRHYMNRYHEEGISSVPLNLELGEYDLAFIASVHRAVKHSRGNCVLVGSLGQPIYNLAQLALYIAEYSIHTPPDEHDTLNIYDVMKSLFRLAGLEGKQVALIMQENDLHSSHVASLLNSFMSCCELPTLFTVEEMTSLIHALLPAIRRDFPSEPIDPEQYFTARVCQNLRIILCVTPDCDILNNKAHSYQGMLQQSHVIWMEEGNPVTIKRQAMWFFTESPLSLCIDDDYKTSLADSITSIHSYMLVQSGSLHHTGVTTSKLADTSTYHFLLEKITSLLNPHSNTNELPLSYVGPLSLRYLLESLCRSFRERSDIVKNQTSDLKQALGTLESIQNSVKDMQTTLDKLRQKLHQTSLQSTRLLQQVTDKSCQLERAKALLGSSGPVLSAMRMVSEQKRLLSENEEDDKELLAVFFDQLSQKSSRIELMMERTLEKLKLAEKEVKETKQAMIQSKEQAHYWRNKIDRNTIEQIKSLPNPPALVGTIMELMLQLLNQSTSSLVRRVPTVSSRLDREYWSQLQLAIGDSQHFLDLLDNLKWEDGLSPRAIELIESKLSTSQNSADNIMRSESSTTDSTGTTGSSQPLLITVSMARHASESAAIMCEFAVAIVDYQYSFQPHHNAVKRVEKLKGDIEALKKEIPIDLTPEHSGISQNMPKVDEGDSEELQEKDLVVLETNLNDLKSRFDQSVMEKHNLQKTCQTLVTKLKLARNLLESLQPRLEEWNKKLSDLPSTHILLNTCLIAAAVLTYCGPLPAQSMQRTLNHLVAQCVPNSLSPHLTVMESLSQFLLTPAEYHHLSLEGLPLDQYCILTSCLIGSAHTSQWSLVLDPLGMACEWIHTHFQSKGVDVVMIEHNDNLFSSTLTQAMSEGKTLVVADVNVHQLTKQDDILSPAISIRRKLSRKKPLKLTVDGKEVDCSCNFQLILVTASPTVPKLLSSQCSVILFHPECSGLETRLLDEFLRNQNTKTFNELTQLRQDIYTQFLRLDTLDRQLLSALSSEDDVEMEAKTINKLLTLNKSFEFAQESLLQSRQLYEETITYHLSTFSSLANRAAIIIDTVFQMKHIHPLYYTSMRYALNVFKAYIIQTGNRIQGDDALAKLTKFGHSYFEKGFIELDKQVFTLLLALNIEASEGRATLCEREYLIHPVPGSKFLVRGLLNQLPYDNTPVINFGKKPFDWMNEDQWQKLLTIASHFDWIHPILHGLGKDGKEMSWRTVGEGTAPEIAIQSFGMGLKLTHLQQFIIHCALRPERVSQFALVFSARVLEQKPLSPNYIDLQGAVKGPSVANLTPLIIYQHDPQLPVIKLQYLAQKNQVSVKILSLLCIEDSQQVEDLIENARQLLSENQWVLLHQANDSPQLMQALAKLMESRQQNRNEGGRLWLSVDMDTVTKTLQILKYCYRIAMDQPKSPLNSLTHFFHLCGQDDIVSISPRTEWLPLLHSLAMFHIILTLRKDVCHWCFQKHYMWNYSHLLDALSFILSEFVRSDSFGRVGLTPVSWSGIRYMIAEVIYGALVTDSTDLIAVGALTEHWFHPGGPKRESGTYHIPTIFFTPNTRLNSLLQAVENALPPLVPSTLLCGLHYTSEMRLGWREDIFSSLKHLHQLSQLNVSSCPFFSGTVSPSLVAGTAGRASRGTAQAMSAMSIISAIGKKQTQLAPWPTRIVDKLPTYITLPVNMLNCQLDFTRLDMVATAIMDASLAKDLNIRLLKTITKLLDSFCIGWKKEVLVERIRKHTSSSGSTFGHFLAQETSTMNRCLQRITEDLQCLQKFLKEPSGDVFLFSPHLVETALSLLCLKVPPDWYATVGPSSPPVKQWDLKDWLTDIVMRFAFIDKVLTWGIERTSTYWLGAFFHPQALLSIFQQNTVLSHAGNEQVIFVGELTNRDKDHIRDPPSDGLFLYGAYLWGTHFEKTTTLELHDIPPRSTQPSLFPILHLSLKPLSHVLYPPPDSKPPFVHYVPCVHTRDSNRLLFYLKISSNDITSNRWTLRNLICTLRPF